MTAETRRIVEDRDSGMDALLSLNGTTFNLDNGYWVKFTAYQVTPNKHKPHGIDYSLTLHNRYNDRIIGFDNDHAPPRKRKGYVGRKVEWDHEHKIDIIQPYDFKTPVQLLEDFWASVNKVKSK